MSKAEQVKIDEPKHWLDVLRSPTDPSLIKTREGYRDRQGNMVMLNYVEWHTVADILDDVLADKWGFEIVKMECPGDMVIVQGRLTIELAHDDGTPYQVTRDGVGVGKSNNELGVKAAASDSLKRAAVLFGIARDLYEKEPPAHEQEAPRPPTQQPRQYTDTRQYTGDPVNARGPQPSGNSRTPDTRASTPDDFPLNPVSQNMSDLVSAKQLGMIRALARDKQVDPDDECRGVMNCKAAELTRRAASALIQHLQSM